MAVSFNDKKTLFISSQMADHEAPANNFTAILPCAIDKISGMHFTNMSVPAGSMYTIDTWNNRLYYTDSNAAAHTITLTPGFYNAGGVAAELQAQLNVLVIDTFTVTYSALTGLITITLTAVAGGNDVTLDMRTGTLQPGGFDTEISRLLGFTFAVHTLPVAGLPNSVVGTSVYDGWSGQDIFYVKINNPQFEPSINNYAADTETNRFLMDVIPRRMEYGLDTLYKSTDVDTNRLWYDGTKNLGVTVNIQIWIRINSDVNPNILAPFTGGVTTMRIVVVHG